MLVESNLVHNGIAIDIGRCPSPEIDTTADPLKSIKKSKRKRVRFNSKVAVQNTISLQDMESNEMRAMWYNVKEYRYMKAYSFILAEHVAAGKVSAETDIDSVRGLEHFTHVGHQRREEKKMAGWRAVFVEQERQLNYNIVDGQKIAELYHSAGQRSREEARDRASQDAMAVKRIQIVGEIKDDSFPMDSTQSTVGSSSHPRSMSRVRSEKERRRQRRLPNLLPWKRLSRRNRNANAPPKEQSENDDAL